MKLKSLKTVPMEGSSFCLVSNDTDDPSGVYIETLFFDRETNRFEPKCFFDEYYYDNLTSRDHIGWFPMPDSFEIEK